MSAKHCICGGKLGAFDISAKSYVDHGEIKFSRCMDCESLTSEDYDRSDLYSSRDSINYTARYNIFSLLKEKFLALSFRNKLPSKNVAILDYGCGSGELANALKKNGWTDVYAADVQRERPGGLLEEVPYCPISELGKMKPFDFVIARHVFEHIEELDVSIKHLHSYMSDKGILFCEVPNVASPFRSLMGSGWPGFFAPYHVYVFSINGLSRAFERNGFKVEAVSQSDSPVMGSYLAQFGVPNVICKISTLATYLIQLGISKVMGRSESFLITFSKK